jgi:hypothetical protein
MPEELTTTATADGEQQETQVTEQVETGDTGQVTTEQQTEQTTQTETTQTEKTFTQSQLDEIVKKRIEKEQTRLENEHKTAAQQARDAVIAEMEYVWKGKPIKTEAEYRQALKEKQIEDSLRQQYSNVPDEIVNKLVELDRFREETLAERKTREESERKAQEEKDFATRRDSMYDEFMTEFSEYDTEEKWKGIPKEVWAESEKWLKSGGREGRRLADALTRYNWKQNMAQQKANDANQANADSSTGSVKGQGKTGSYFTREQVAAMSREEIRENYAAIKESEKRWK